MRRAGPGVLGAILALVAAGVVAADPSSDLLRPRVACDTLLNPPPATGVPQSAGAGAAAQSSANSPPIRRVLARGEERPAAGPTPAPAVLRVMAPAAPGAIQRIALRASAPVLDLNARTVSVAPGTTVLIEIAIDHLNRIVTPFDAPEVHTVSTASTSIEGRALYVATNTEEPVVLWITNGPSNDTALSLTLTPRHVPPREIRVSVPGYRARGVPATDRAPASAPGASTALSDAGDGDYADTLTDLLRAMAQQHLPDGFQVRANPAPTVRCEGKVLKTQVAVGPTMSIVTVGISNPGPSAITMNEAACDVAGHQVAAMGAWPRKRLAAHETTEVFLVIANVNAR